MATRLYLPASGGGTPPIAPTPDTQWERTGGHTTVFAATSPTGNACADAPGADSTATLNRDTIIRQHLFALDTGKSFATTDTLKAQILAYETNALDNVFGQIVVRIVSSTGTVVRATLYAGDTATTGVAANPTQEWGITKRNSKFPRAGAVALQANYTTVAGDYLVVETGYRKWSTRNITPNIRYCSNSGTDLPQDESSTSDFNAWIEFSNTFTTVYERGVIVAAAAAAVAPKARVKRRGKTAPALASSVTVAGNVAAPGVTHQASLAVTAGAAATVSGRRRKRGVLTSAAALATTIAAISEPPAPVVERGSLVITCVATATVAGRRRKRGVAASAATALVIPKARRRKRGVSVVAAASTVVPKARRRKRGVVGLPTAATATATGRRRKRGATVAPVMTTVAPSARERQHATILIPAVVTTSVKARRQTTGSSVSVALAGVSVAATARRVERGSLQLVTTSGLTVTARARRRDSVTSIAQLAVIPTPRTRDRATLAAGLVVVVVPSATVTAIVYHQPNRIASVSV